MAFLDDASKSEDFLNQTLLLALARNLGSTISLADREIIVDQVLRLIRDYYVHLPLKTSSLAIDPVQELLLLLDDVRYIDTDLEFFTRLLTTIKKLRDRHTSLEVPGTLGGGIAFLPFAVESYWEGDRRQLIVSKLLTNLGDPDFVVGVEVTHWNGVPIAKHIERIAWETEGGNPFARIAVALRSLTIRPLAYMLPPDEDWVVVTYVSNGNYKAITVPWRIYMPGRESAVQRTLSRAGQGDQTAQGIDQASNIVNSGWQDLYAGGAHAEWGGVFLDNDPVANVPNPLQDHFYFRLVRYATKLFGYVRIFSFAAPDTQAFLTTFAEFLKLMPPTGLIIDTRANPGGTIPAGEGILQMLSQKTILQERIAFRITSAVQRLVESSPLFEPWRRSFGIRYETGSIFTQGFPLPNPSRDLGLSGIYKGPVVLINDALSYSTTDFFAAGFQDNGIGSIIGTDTVSGAGGANVWSHSQLQRLAAEAGDQGLVPLPGGANINVSLRRSTRVGFNEEIPVEGLGVFADHLYRVTRRDVMGRNEDLITFAGYVLSQQ